MEKPGDEKRLTSSMYDSFIESSNRSTQPILVINETGKVLYSNPTCEKQFNITQNQRILFDLEKGGIRNTEDGLDTESSPVPLIPYTNISEIEFDNENCFAITLEQPASGIGGNGILPESVLNNDYQQMPGAIYQALDDEQLTIFQITNGVTTLLGYTPEDLVNNYRYSFISLIHPEDINTVQNGRQEAIRSNNLFELTYRVRHNNGEYKMVRDQGRVLKTETGVVQAIEGWLLPIPGGKNIEEELVESESRLKFFIDASPDAVVYADLNGVIKLANPQFSRMLGISEEMNLNGVNVLSFLAQNDQRDSDKELINSMANGSSYKGYYHAKTVSGQAIPIEVNIRALTSPKGERTGYIAVIRDMSEWERTIKSLETSEAQYRAIVEDNPELIVRFNSEGVVTFCNQSYAGFYGLSVEDLVGHKLIDAVPNTAKPIIQMILNYVSPKMEPSTKEVTHEGTNHDTRWYRWKTRAILNERGALIEYQSVGEDITNEKNTRQAHQISEQMIRGLLESIKLIAIMMDPTGRVTFVNSHFLDVTGWTRQQVLGENWMEKFVPPEVGFQLKKILFDSMVNGKIAQRNDNMILTRTGEQRLISWHNTLIFNDRHIAEGIAAIGEDITERFYAEQTQEVVYKIAQASLTAQTLDDLYYSLHKSLMGLMPAENFFIALYDRQEDIISYPYFADQYDPCPEPAKPVRGLTEYILRTGKTLLVNPEVFNLLVEEESVESIGTPSVDWLGVPLIIDNEVIGAMVTQSYTEGVRFKKRDEQMLTFVSTQVAMAIERKRAEQALLSSQRRSELLIEASTDGIFLEALNGKILDCNEVAAKMYGYTHDEMVNLFVRDLVSPDFLLNKPDYIQWELEHGDIATDVPNIRKDGTIFPVEISTRLAVIDSETYAVAYVRDITERKKAEQAIIESEEKFRSLAQTTAAGIFIHMGGPFAYVNPMWVGITGYTEPELLKMHFMDIIAPDSHDMVEEIFNHRIQNDPFVRRYESEILTKTGQVKWVDITTSGIVYQGVDAIIGTAVDITDRKQKERELEMVAKISESLRVAMTRDEVRPTVLREITGFLDINGAVLSTIETGKDLKILDRATGCFAPADMTQLKVSDGLTGHIIATGKSYVNNDATHDPYFTFPELLSNLSSIAGVPLITKGETIGALLIGSTHIFTDNELRLLKTIGDMTASAIHRADLYEQTSAQAHELKTAYNATLEGWAHALELRDKETQGHSLRIANMTIKLAKRMGYNDQDLENVRRGALLHDIGKMGVPDTVLLKPGNLTEEEWILMRKHPDYAREMLIDLPYFKDALDIPYCHHEWWDGTGYPRGLKGTDIPLIARIFAIVDAWDALISDRPYRKAWLKRDALSHIIDQSGNHFDPDVVNAFVQMLREEKV
jgi:PAS domain S-box-containing protein/putative nucleotidyltransferase with HDIG domain